MITIIILQCDVSIILQCDVSIKNDKNGAKTKMRTLNYLNWWETPTLTNLNLMPYADTNLWINRWEVANQQQYTVSYYKKKIATKLIRGRLQRIKRCQHCDWSILGLRERK